MSAKTQDASVYLDAVRDRLLLLGQVDDALDFKLATLFAAGSAVVALVAGVFALKPTALHGHGVVVIGVAVLVYIALGAVVGSALFPRPYPSNSKIDEVRDDALNGEPINSMKWGVADRLRCDTLSLTTRVRKKSQRLTCAFILLGAEALAFVIATGALL